MPVSGAGARELYDLTTDLLSRYNIAIDNQEMVAELRLIFVNYLIAHQTGFWIFKHQQTDEGTMGVRLCWLCPTVIIGNPAYFPSPIHILR